MTDEVKEKQENEVTDETTGQNDVPSGGVNERTFSQGEVDRMIKGRAEREARKMLSDLGVSSVDELKAIIKQKEEREEAEKSELQKAQERAAELEKQLSAAAEAQKAMAMQTDITAKAAKLGIVDPDAAFKLLDKGAIEYGDDGRPKNTEALLMAMLKERPYLAGTGSSVTNPGKDRTYTREEIEKMTPEQINKNWDAIKSYLERSGK